MSDQHKLVKSTTDILGATFLGQIPWVFEDDNHKTFVVYASYYEHDDGRRFVGTRVKCEQLRAELLGASDAMHREVMQDE